MERFAVMDIQGQELLLPEELATLAIVKECFVFKNAAGAIRYWAPVVSVISVRVVKS
jgi:hypothetical protein